MYPFQYCKKITDYNKLISFQNNTTLYTTFTVCVDVDIFIFQPF